MLRYARLMKRTTIMLPEELNDRLRYEARRRGVSLADVAREAISAYLPEPSADRPLGFIGLGDGPADTSEHIAREVSRLVGRQHDDAT
jgi:hypothetical protein